MHTLPVHTFLTGLVSFDSLFVASEPLVSEASEINVKCSIGKNRHSYLSVYNRLTDVPGRWSFLHVFLQTTVDELPQPMCVRDLGNMD